MEISVVTTMYNSAPYIREFYKRVSKVVQKYSDEYEIIFVNDGSPDHSLEMTLELVDHDRRVSVIDLSRNFGHHKAMMTGLNHAQGKLIYLIDCDLEEEPELFDDFHKTLCESEADVVYGIQESRKGSWIEKVTGELFYKLFNLLSNWPIPNNVTTIRLMSKRYVASLIQHRDREVFIAGLWAITGYKQIPITIQKKSKGSSSYTIRRKLSLFLNSITSFSNKPLIYISYLGIGISLIAGSAALYLIIKNILYGGYLLGWPSLIVSVWLLGGLTIFCLGIIGIYLSKIFEETKDRPVSIVRQIYQQGKVKYER